jgi:hypothetical protein
MASLRQYERNQVEAVANKYRAEHGVIPVDTEVLTSIVEGFVGRPIRTVYRPFNQATVTAEKNCFVIILSTLRAPEVLRTDHTHELAHALHTYDWAPVGKVPNWRINYTGSYPEHMKEEVACEEIGLYLACPPWAVEDFIERYFRFYQLRLLRSPEVRECLRQMTDHFRIPQKDLETQLSAQFPGNPLWRTFQVERNRIWSKR